MENKTLFIIENNEATKTQENQAISGLLYVLKDLKSQLDKMSGAGTVAIKDKKLLSVEEAAELFGIGRGKIRELTNDYRCPFVIWIGGHRKIKRDAFEEFIMKQYSI